MFNAYYSKFNTGDRQKQSCNPHDQVHAYLACLSIAFNICSIGYTVRSTLAKIYSCPVTHVAYQVPFEFRLRSLLYLQKQGCCNRAPRIGSDKNMKTSQTDRILLRRRNITVGAP